MAGLYLRDRIVSKWFDKGVSFIDPESVMIDPDADDRHGYGHLSQCLHRGKEHDRQQLQDLSQHPRH